MSDYWYVQAKLVKYRTDSLEGGTLIEQLSAQTRQDTALIREQADKIDELQQQLNTQKVRLLTVTYYQLSFLSRIDPLMHYEFTILTSHS